VNFVVTQYYLAALRAAWLVHQSARPPLTGICFFPLAVPGTTHGQI